MSMYDRAEYLSGSGVPREELDRMIRTCCEESLRAGKPYQLVRADMLACSLDHCRIAVTKDDLFAGIFDWPDTLIKLREDRRVAVRAEKMQDYEVLFSALEKDARSATQLDISHVSPDWESILSLGLTGLLERAEKAYQETPSVFLESVMIVYKAFIRLTGRLAAACDQCRRTDLGDMLRDLLARPPQTLQEALELGFLFHEVQEHEGEPVRSMGIFDRLYRPFYEHDLANGTLTPESAEELLKIYFCRFPALSHGLTAGVPFCFGGMLPDGSGDGCCELTEIAWRAFRELGMVDPKFSLRVNSRTPEKLLLEIAEGVKAGCNSIVFANEEVARKLFLKRGKREEDLANFIPIGCYEPAIMGHELSSTMSAVFNLAAVIPDAMDEKVPATFEEFFQNCLAVMDAGLIRIMKVCTRWEELWNDINPSPFLSGSFRDCIDSSCDVTQYGTRYATSGIVCYGLATAADSLAAVEEIVFKSKLATFEELREILNNNWQDHETLCSFARKRCPKWGCGNVHVDAMAKRLCDAAAQRINHTPNAKGGTYQMGCWSIDMYTTSGRSTRPTPDGRRAGDVISKNCSSTLGCDAEGVAGLIASAAALDHSEFADGSVLDVMLPPRTVAGADGARFITALIRNYFERGGLFIQFNILSADQLRKAQQHPEEYQHLQIRLCGWNVRFTDLPKIHQDCLIKEAESHGE